MKGITPRRLGCVVAAGLALMAANRAAAADPQAAADDLFEIHARPLLVAHCIRCHGETKQEAGLNLATRAGILAGGESGPAVVPGKPEASLLLEALRYESLEMPPTGRLDDAAITGIERWVAAGAPWPEATVLAPANPIKAGDRDWWCYRPIAAPSVPEPPGETPDWCRNEIDRFILHRLTAEGLAPAAEAPPATLLRRLHYAVTGLPPTEQMLDETTGGESLRDASASERLVDQLLASPAYGEHQARFWLDLVRYADTDGYRADGHRPHASEYRDYVIRSFNTDKPYDRFVTEQLAGDEIDPGNRDAIVATMFLRHWIYEWNQRDVEGQWQKILDDLTETTADVFLAQSLKCARCHDHKFDPLLQKDYYRLQAFFAPFQPTEARPVADRATLLSHGERMQAWKQATAHIRRRLHEIERPVLLAHATGEKPTMFPPEIQALLAAWPDDLTAHERQIVALASRQFKLFPEKIDEWLDEKQAAERRELLDQLAAHDSLKPEPLPTQAFVAGDVGPAAPVTCFPDDRTKTAIEPGFLTLLDPAAARIEQPPVSLGTTGRRTALARWITSPDNPLTARVIVNRVWQQHFGRGLSPSTSDLGHLGQPPSHPELLDWLASRFIRDGWSLKKLHRLILTSATFRQASDRPLDDRLAAVDPENRLLWRMPSRRLSGEEVTDTVLAASGAVTPGMTGQRAIYNRVRRNAPDPLLAAFDLPDRIQSAGERHVTTTPMQALLLANGYWAQNQARMITRTCATVSDVDLVGLLHRRLFGRDASADEIERATEFVAAYESLTPHEPVAFAADRIVPFPGAGSDAEDRAVNLAAESGLAIDLPATDPLPEADFTIRAFVLLRSLYDDAKVRTIAAAWSGDRTEPGWSLGVTSTKSRYEPRNLILQLVGKTIDADNIHYEVVPSNLRLELDRPYFVAVSVDLDDLSERGITFFVRDLSRPDAPLEAASVPHEVNRFIKGDEPLRLGTRPDDQSWDGLIGRLQLDAASLSREEIEARKSPEKVVDWRFDTPADIGHDASGRGHHARVTVGATARLGPHEQARAALVHALLNSSEMLYLD
jgi:mono/diheme cytochrome c family protein